MGHALDGRLEPDAGHAHVLGHRRSADTRAVRSPGRHGPHRAPCRRVLVGGGV
ncbi:hypothetical protein FHS32_001383 [Streptomyces albaduncus]|uniref:Uncharacterized protein n=1 Tax=Streptomyces griseoloalbus TaxID=67303 RepID=A0A7W8F8S0_9ACTN|nr:hypothetical protein [Streptomyces albaduncus]